MMPPLSGDKKRPMVSKTASDRGMHSTRGNVLKKLPPAMEQGLLELGFYRGLYSVWERTLEKYPSVWIEGCVSAAGATVCCLSDPRLLVASRQAEGD